jgi:hypothetical protein
MTDTTPSLLSKPNDIYVRTIEFEESEKKKTKASMDKKTAPSSLRS